MKREKYIKDKIREGGRGSVKLLVVGLTIKPNSNLPYP